MMVMMIIITTTIITNFIFLVFILSNWAALSLKNSCDGPLFRQLLREMMKHTKLIPPPSASVHPELKSAPTLQLLTLQCTVQFEC